MKEDENINLTVPDDFLGQRLDKVLASLLPQYSRSMMQKWIKQSLITVDDEVISQKQKLLGGEDITIFPPQLDIEKDAFQAQAIDLEIVYEDQDVIVINKPAGLVVHPGAGNTSGTLMNGLLYYNSSLFSLPRAGIVHRLDKQTSGLMVVSKNHKSRLSLIQQLQDRSVSRTYLAWVNGVPIAGTTIDKPIARNQSDRKKMAVYSQNHDFAKEAITHFKVMKKYRRHAMLEVKLETGRTHQIRVHMQHLNYPLIGDPQYGQRLQLHHDMSDILQQQLKEFHRQALHAFRLEFIHPQSAQIMSFEADVPDDLMMLTQALDNDLIGK